MSKTLVVSDNEILNQLYLINFEVYLGTEVIVVESTKKAQKILESNISFNLIVSMNMMNGHDSAVVLHDFLKINNIKTPLIIIGNPIQEIENIIVVQSSYYLKTLLQTCAKVLGVTPKSMSNLAIPDYFSVDINFLSKIKIAPCQIFLQLKKNMEEENYAMIAKKGSSTVEIIKRFQLEGITTLYVNKYDRLLMVNQISNDICELVKNSEKLGVNEKSYALQAGFEFVASDFCQTEEAALEVMNIANACTKVMDDMMKDIPGLRSLIQLLNSNKNGFIYSHSILSSFVASHIVKHISWGGEGHLEKINFVLFFHDIVLAPIYLKHPNLKYEEDLLFSSELSEKEKEVVLNHARLSAEHIISFRKAPMGADLLIKQHHGMTNGIGFANEYKDDISPLSKIIIISEAFVEDFMKARENDSNYQIDLKRVLPNLNEKFRKSSYKKIIASLENISL